MTATGRGTERRSARRRHAAVARRAEAQRVLRVEGLAKAYGEHQAVVDVSLDVRAGEVFGLLGRNGAGKSTSIGMICGLLPPDRGVIEVQGRPATGSSAAIRAAQRHLGYAPQDISLFNLLPARENLEFMAGARGIGRRQVPAAVDRVVGLLELGGLLDQPVGTMSGGEQRRVQLAMALVHRPSLLVLDEPTAGVDVVSRLLIQRVLKDVAAEGVALLYTTHYLEEAQALCDRVAVIERGSVIAMGAVADLIDAHGSGRIAVRTSRPAGRVARRVAQLPGVSAVKREADGLVVNCSNPDGLLGPVLAAFLDAGCSVSDVNVVPASLEAAFINVTGLDVGRQA